MPSAMDPTEDKISSKISGKGSLSLALLACPFIRSQYRSIKKPVQYSNTAQVFLFCLGTIACSCFSCFPCSFPFSTGEKFPKQEISGLDRSQIWPQIPKSIFYEARNHLWWAKPAQIASPCGKEQYCLTFKV